MMSSTSRRAGGSFSRPRRPLEARSRDAQEKFPDHVDDVLPVVDAHRDQGGKVQEHREKHLGLLHVFHGEEVLEQGQVAELEMGRNSAIPCRIPIKIDIQ